MEAVSYRLGDVIYREGEHGELFYRVLEGSVRVVIDCGKDTEKTLTALTAGDFFGELSAVGGYPRSATVIAAEDGTRLLPLTAAGMEEYFAEDPDAVLSLLRHLGRRIRELSADCAEASGTLADLKAARATPRPESLLQRFRFIASQFFGTDRGRALLSEEARQAAQKSRAGKDDSRVKAYRAGTVLYREGEPGRCMYRVHWGRVGIVAGLGTGSERTLTQVMADQFFGLMGMLEGADRRASAVILDDETTLEEIRPEDIPALFRSNPGTVWMILEHTALRLRRLTDDYAAVCRQIADLRKA